MTEQTIMNLPDELGAVIDLKIKEANPDLPIGWMLIAVSHGMPIQTMSNVDEHTQLMMTQIANNAIAAEQMAVSTLLNPEGSA
jgi:hypothetical protein